MCMKYLKGSQLPVNEGDSIFPQGFDTVWDNFIDTPGDAIGI